MQDSRFHVCWSREVKSQLLAHMWVGVVGSRNVPELILEHLHLDTFLGEHAPRHPPPHLPPPGSGMLCHSRTIFFLVQWPCWWCLLIFTILFFLGSPSLHSLVNHVELLSSAQSSRFWQQVHSDYGYTTADEWVSVFGVLFYPTRQTSLLANGTT